MSSFTPPEPSLNEFNDLDEELYRETLQEAAAWTAYKEAEEELTYPGTWNVPDLVKAFQNDAGKHGKRRCTVNGITDVRRVQLYSHAAPHPEVEEGRVLAVYLDQSLSDGAGMPVSNDYVNMSYVPPTDTWITYLVEETSEGRETGILLSYVPEEAVGRVQEAIDVNPECCLGFVDDAL